MQCIWYSINFNNHEFIVKQKCQKYLPVYLGPIVFRKRCLLIFHVLYFCLFNYSKGEATTEVEAIHCFIDYSLKAGKPFWRRILRKPQVRLNFLHISPIANLDQTEIFFLN